MIAHGDGAEAVNAWNPVVEPVALGDATQSSMLVGGRTFCISTPAGDIEGRPGHGLFVGDHRVLSRLELRIDGAPVDPLADERLGSRRLRLVGRTRHEPGRPPLTVIRDRQLNHGLVDHLTVRNYGTVEREIVVRLTVACDFAELFAVKENRAFGAERPAQERDGGLKFRSEASVVVVEAPAAEADQTFGTLVWRALLPPNGEWRGSVSVTVSGLHVPRVRRDVRPLAGAGVLHCRSWSPDLDLAVRRSIADLDALRLPDPDGGDRAIIAAGAPWYMTLFGRDSLFTSWMALPLDPNLALGVLDALARRQGTAVVPEFDEQPGRILHEVRGLTDPSADLGASVYFGSIDSTPLFVILLDELDRWGELPAPDRARLLYHADRALEWIDEFGDRDGDGFVEYLRGTPAGLMNQGWKDSWDGVRYLDGRVAEAPIALCEVQAYVYGAWVARAALARRCDDELSATVWQDRADDLRQRFDDAFWCPRAGGYAFGLDARKDPIDAPSSNMGHVLWTGLARPDRAARVAATLVGDAMWSGWGVRTLSERCAAFDPLSYHCGSVWPHDNAIVAAGLARYGFRNEANIVIRAQLEAAAHFGGAMPELFAGFHRVDVGIPVRYPTSCAPQAWSAAAPLAHLRTLLGLGFDDDGSPTVDPDVPDDFGPIRLDGMRIAGSIASVAAERTHGEITLHPSVN